MNSILFFCFFFSKLFSWKFSLLSFINFSIILGISIKTPCWIFYEITLNLQISLKSVDILRMLNLSGHLWCQIISSTLNYETSLPNYTFLVKFGLMIGSPLELAIGRLFTVTLTLQGIELPAIVYWNCGSKFLPL